MTDPARWPLGVTGLAYGGDYNPDQWPDDVQIEDVALMQEAGVNLVSVAIFSWARIEPAPGVLDWQWLDDTMDRLHDAGVKVALATATASPPPWLVHAHPEILPVAQDGTVLGPGSRQHYRIASPVWRQHVLRLTRLVAERYATHPALALWHVDNELGCHVPHDYSDDAAAGFRRWLKSRYGGIDALNTAWGTSFWSQRYSTFDEVLPPRSAPTSLNPAQQLDFARYSSDAWLEHYRAIRDVLRDVTPHVPATTNFMVTTRNKWMDYVAWAEDMDVVANDHYLIGDDPEAHVELAFSADLTRGVAGGKPWILMEHSSSAVNWQPHNRAKRPGEMLRNSFQHVAHGADAVMFFQWRASASGAEKYHSALVPHAGTDSRVWRRTVELGSALRSVAELRGSRVRSRVALVFSYPAWWGAELDSHPSVDISYPGTLLAHYRALWRRNVTVDVVPPGADLTGYDLVVVPTLYLLTADEAANVAGAAEHGATVLVTYFSGIVDEHDRVHLGGYPGAFRDLLGVRTEEFWPLLPGEVHTLDDGTRADLWSEDLHLEPGTVAMRTFSDGDLAGVPALTRRTVPGVAGSPDGSAWYLATRPDAEGLQRLTDLLLAEAGIEPDVVTPAGVEVVRRHDGATTWLVAVNHTSTDATLRAAGHELLTGTDVTGRWTVPAGAVRVLREG
ncbi:beta-galactosidase [Actinotalea sp. M2MS4P-6]|uniref:beta-galactosidase n=1 Tax=Actinotalea sp. M2MS4P-6 TaxID=2983762 RepID=UPI0021E4DE2D|nr:beta-galactosidase [Actinotalea sp. M2MS4P-6]MCV2394433.1 beta-galactosidase [Actinotalea sp. M2MS4P-6]